jgi:hypothetical protein
MSLPRLIPLVLTLLLVAGAGGLPAIFPTAMAAVAMAFFAGHGSPAR